MAPLRVLVAEDSPTARALLVAVLAEDPELTVVGEARTGLEVLAMAKRLRPDLITMDIAMPDLDGLEATERIMIEAPTPIIIVSSAVPGREAELSMQAMDVGALAVVPKPAHPLAPEFERQRRQLLATVKAMAQVKLVRRWQRAARITPVESATPWVPGHRSELVAIAASTGGPAVLHQILESLPSTFGAPILVVQHIAAGFAEAFATWLDGACPLRVKLAEHGELLSAGTVYVAPDGGHLETAPGRRARVRAGPAVGGFIPAATCLFESVAAQYGAAAVGVILTGMGGDGVPGLRKLRTAGAPVLAQDEATAVVYGMPGEAVRAGVVTAVLPPAAIAARLMSYVTGEADEDTSARR